MPKRFTTLIATLALLMGGSSATLAFPAHSPWPGGLLVSDLGDAGNAAPTATLDGKDVAISQFEGRWVAVAGIPLGTDSKNKTLRITQHGETRQQSFALQSKHYEEQRITITNNRLVNPYANDMDRITRERNHLSQVKRTRSGMMPDLNFARPVAGRESSQFGLRRFFNDQPRNPHSGLDIAAAEGTPVLSPSAGVVIDTGEYFFNGGSVYVDHGQGVISLFAHLSSIDVSVGQFVYRGDPVGKVGSTGRVTAPHLHWTVYANRSYVDPKLLLVD